DRDQSQHDLVAERPPAQRHLDLAPLRQVPANRIGRRLERQPAVAPKAAVPAQAVVFASDDPVLWAQLRDICAEQSVAANAAHKQFVVEPRKKTSWPDRAGRWRG